MKYLPVIVFIFLLGCKNKTAVNDKTVTVTDSVKIKDSLRDKYLHDSIRKVSDSIEKAMRAYAKEHNIPLHDEVKYEAGTISRDILKKPSISIKSPEKIDEVMKALFPGNMYTVLFVDEIIQASFWKSEDKKYIELHSAYVGEGYPFPSDIEWETRFEDSFYYQVNNENYFAFFFSSFPAEYELLRVGRFSCATYGAAVFRQTAAGWVLEHYNPAVGCFGMFGTPQKPGKIKLGHEKYGFILRNGYAGPGGPVYNDIYIFLLENTIPKVLFVNNIERAYASFSHWDTEIKTDMSKSLYSPLSLITSGYYNVVDVDSFFIEEKTLDKNFYQLHDGKNYRFIQKRNYAWKNDQYVLIHEDFSFKTAPLDTINGNPE